MKWINLPIYVDVKLNPVKNRGQTYGGKNLSVSEEGLVLGFPEFQTEYTRVYTSLCLNPRYLLMNVFYTFTYLDGLTGKTRFAVPIVGTDLIGVVSENVIGGGNTYLTMNGYRADSPYFYQTSLGETVGQVDNLGYVSNLLLREVSVKFQEALPVDKYIQLSVGGVRSNETYLGVSAGQVLKFTFPETPISYGVVEFVDDTDKSIVRSVAQADRYVKTGTNYNPPATYPAIEVNGHYAMRGLLYTGRYILGKDTDDGLNLLYSELPVNIQSIYIGEPILAVAHFKNSVFVFTSGSVFETNLKSVNRICNAIPDITSLSVVSTDAGIFALAHNTVYFLTQNGFVELVKFPNEVLEISPSWTNKSVYARTVDALYEVSLYGVWEIKCPVDGGLADGFPNPEFG